MKISVLSHGDFVCGISAYTGHLIKALNMVGLEAELVSPKNIGNPDIILLTNIGLSNEMSNKVHTEASKKRLEELGKYWGKVPFALVVHTLSDYSFFKRSYEYFENKVFDLVVAIERGKDIFAQIEQTLSYKSCIHIALPFEFDDNNFEDKSQYADQIVSPSRLTSSKKSDIVLEIAEKLEGKKKFFVVNPRAGTFWYFRIKNHPGGRFAEFINEYTDFREIYKDVAFAIDLTYQHWRGFVSTNKFQYTGIEAVDCGVIPIGFDVWRPRSPEEGYDGAWLPSPVKVGRKMTFDVERCAEIIEDYKYDFKVAEENRRILKKICDLRSIGEQWKLEFKRLLG